ncbi:MAG: hypothetical protein WBP11_05710 [Dokdonella sp.]
MRVFLASLNTVVVPYPVFPLGVAYLRDAVMAAGRSNDPHGPPILMPPFWVTPQEINGTIDTAISGIATVMS